MENHVDFAILQRLDHLRLRIEALHSKVQPPLLKAVRRIEDIVRDNALKAAVLLIRKEAAVSLQNAHADCAMLRQPRLLVLGKHRHGCRRHIVLIQLLGIKRLVLLDSAHSLIQLGLEIRTVFVDCKINIRAAHRRNRRQALLSQRRNLRRHNHVSRTLGKQPLSFLHRANIDMLGVQSLLLFPIAERRLHHAACNHANALAFQQMQLRGRKARLFYIGIKIIFFSAHRHR